MTRELGGHKKKFSHLEDLMVRGPARGYFPYPSKIIFVVSEKNLQWAQMFFQGMGLQVVTWSRYLDSFIVDELAQETWMGGNVQSW